MDRVHSRLDRPHGALLVGHQRRVARAGPAGDARHDLLGVAQLRDHLGMHERRHLDARHTRRGQQVDDLDLLIGGDEVRLDLEPVPGPDLTDRHTLGQSHRLPPASSGQTLSRRRGTGRGPAGISSV